MFHEFLGLVPYSYWTLASRPEDRVRALGIDRAWRYLSERLDLYLLPAIEDADSESEARSVQAFAETALSQFSRLLKEAYDERHLADFERALTRLDGHPRVGPLGPGWESTWPREPATRRSSRPRR